jgi:hypothetical protein
MNLPSNSLNPFASDLFISTTIYNKNKVLQGLHYVIFQFGFYSIIPLFLGNSFLGLILSGEASGGSNLTVQRYLFFE